MRVALLGDWVARLDGVEFDVPKDILTSGIGALQFDAAELGHWDSGLIALLVDLREAAKQDGVAFDEEGLPKSARRLLQLLSAPAVQPPADRTRPLLDRVGLWAIDIWTEGVEASALVGNMILRGAVALRGRAAMVASDLIEAMYNAGVAALPIVAVVGLLVGGILAFIGATELSKFGAGLYVANLVAIGMVREMAALMTAIIMAGRTGGAYAAQIAAMEGAEEIDALRALGVPIFDYLILPKVLALSAMMPLLYMFGCLIGIFGGLCIGRRRCTSPRCPFSWKRRSRYRALHSHWASPRASVSGRSSPLWPVTWVCGRSGARPRSAPQRRPPWSSASSA